MGEEALKDYISILKDQLRIRILPSSQQSLKNILKIGIVVHCFLLKYRVHVHIQSSRSFYTPDQIRQNSLCTGLVVMQFVHPRLDQTVQFMYRPSCYVVCTPPTRLDSTFHVHAQLLCSLYTPYQIKQYSSCTGLVVMQFVHPLLDQTVQFMYRSSRCVVCTPPTRLDSTVHVQAQMLCSLYTPYQIQGQLLCRLYNPDQIRQ